MIKKNLFISAFSLVIAAQFAQTCFAAETGKSTCNINLKVKGYEVRLRDTVPPAGVMEVVNTAINSLNNFNIDAVANLYTPNALVADDEPPYSWNGPTAGVQWVNAVERVCKENHLSRLKGSIA